MALCQVLCSTRYLYSFLYFLTTTCEVPLLQLTVSHEEAHRVERSGFTQFRSYCLVSWDSDLVFGLPCANHPGPPQHLALETVGETVERQKQTQVMGRTAVSCLEPKDQVGIPGFTRRWILLCPWFCWPHFVPQNCLRLSPSSFPAVSLFPHLPPPLTFPACSPWPLRSPFPPSSCALELNDHLDSDL